MILNSIDTQFTLSDAGEISWQQDMTNPMAGDPVAQIQKGDSTLAPACILLETDILKDTDKDAVKLHIETWLHNHIKTVLEPLFLLQAEDIPEGKPREVCAKIIEGMGTVLRSDLQDLISEMSEEERDSLRSKKIRFGPLIVYLPLLNKPAAVRLRAMLLTLSQGKDLPATVPADGIVSYSIDGQDVDTDYYRAIGYPVYGPRSIRVDMLDRVICAVYDTAKEGKFQAQHQMAEWLGSNIDDLYLILSAMGHKKIEPKIEEATEEENTTDAKSTEEPKEAPEEEKKETKPELATFWLKRGKASDNKKPSRNRNDQKKVKSFKSKKKKSSEKKQPRERVYTAEAKVDPADSPFAILEQLKSSSKDS